MGSLVVPRHLVNPTVPCNSNNTIFVEDTSHLHIFINGQQQQPARKWKFQKYAIPGGRRPLALAGAGCGIISCSASSSLSSWPAASSAATVEETHRLQYDDDDNRIHQLIGSSYDDDADVYDPHDSEEDPRQLKEIWREIQGCNDWEGLVDPTMNSHLRREIIRYGEFSQACYDSFDFDPHSKYCGSCKYLPHHFFDRMHMSNFGYQMSRYLYATSNINLPNFFQKSSIRSIWSPNANWMGYVAVADNEEEVHRLGRRDIMIAWRGTVTYLEWIHDLNNILCPTRFRENPSVQIESGFYDLYTTREEDCKYCSFSARQQVLAEVKRLIDRFPGQELSITVTGHSLGAALAMLTAYDLAEMRVNVVKSTGDTMKKIPITVFSFASPRVGNLRFKERCDELGVKVLRVVNVHDKVPTMPGLIANEKLQFQKYLEEKVHFPWSYAHVGTELALDHSHSPFLDQSQVNLSSAHNLEAHLHLVDGYRGKGRRFSLANKRDIALVNKDSSLLKPDYGVPPFWRQDHNKGMIRNHDGQWLIPERPRVEPHPDDTAHHFAQVLKLADDPFHVA